MNPRDEKRITQSRRDAQGARREAYDDEGVGRGVNLGARRRRHGLVAGGLILALMGPPWAGPAEAAPAHQLCRTDQLTRCVRELSVPWREALGALSEDSLESGKEHPVALPSLLRQLLNGQGGVTLLRSEEALILLNPEVLQQSHLVLLDAKLYERPSLRNYRSTYYHELGHVATRHSPWLEQLQRPDWPEHWPEEVLADLYLYWRLLREGAGKEELWAQLHLRNIGLMQARPDWGHWSTPVLMPLLCRFDELQIWSDWPFPAFLNAALAEADWPLSAYKALGERQFALTPPAIPQPYRYSEQRAPWAALLQPTLEWLGVDTAAYLARHRLPLAMELCPGPPPQ